MSLPRNFWLGPLISLIAMAAVSVPAAAQQQQKPNILFIMGDDIGWMQPSIYHRGLMVGETPNIDRIGQEGAIFMDYVPAAASSGDLQPQRHPGASQEVSCQSRERLAA